MKERVIRVNARNGSYPICVAPGCSATIGERVGRVTPLTQAVLIADERVGPAVQQVVFRSLQGVCRRGLLRIGIRPSEKTKTLNTAGRLYDAILAQPIDRSTVVVALGGGVVGDVSGFVAATLLRGLPFVQIPTTLLAMVDASVGGKAAVNHPRGKNLIGAFHPPVAVFVDPTTLSTLPARQVRSGLAECIKHEIIRDARGFASLEKNILRAVRLELSYLTELIAHNVEIKAAVVEADPTEQGARAHLNFGHTFGHAIEKVSGFRLTHGEAIALGMCAAAHAARSMKMLDNGSYERIVNLIDRAELPVCGLKLPVAAILQTMLVDKKSRDGKVRFVLPDRIGHVVVRDDVPARVVRDAVESLRR